LAAQVAHRGVVTVCDRLRPHGVRFYARQKSVPGKRIFANVPRFTTASHTRCVKAWTVLRFAWLAFAVCAFLLPINAAAAAPHVEQADLNGDINNIMSAYIQTSVTRAEADHADALLVVINTPGGISTSMDEIVTNLLNSSVPVIAYVYPSGARAASAGLFVAQSADVLAMAPGTNIGSAHPIDATGANLTGDLGTKVLNDAVTRVRSLAAIHGRNADWAEDAVRNSVNINAEDAVRLHVADLEANDIPSLLREVDGRQVPRTNGALTIHSVGALVDDFPMPFWQVFLNALIDPTIAALLILGAGYGIITEMSNPGLILPGVIGGIAAVLAIVSLANLPVNIAGGLMMLLALFLFVADIKAPTHGFLSVGGAIALVLGMAFLVNTGPVGLGVNPIVSVLTGVVTLAFFTFFIRKVWVARRQPAFSGPESMVGAVGEAREAISPDGLVFVNGALWKASAESPIAAGTQVRVVGRQGLALQVAPENGESKEKR
jgi:membrane-bound serine protease (ClpP class)